MGWTVASTAAMAGVPTNGMTVYLYSASRGFALPNTDDPVPDGLPADYGPFTSAPDPVRGNGYFTGAVTDAEAYFYTALGSDGHTYWQGPVPGQLDTTQQPLASGVEVSGSRSWPVPTTLSSGITLPLAGVDLVVASVSAGNGWKGSGLIAFQDTTGRWVFASYTGIDAVNHKFTGVTTLNAVAGATSNAGVSVYQAWQNGPRRRTVRVSGDWEGASLLKGLATVNGTFRQVFEVGLAAMASTGHTAGMLYAFAGSVVPTGFLLCDGSAVSRTTYAALFAAIGTTWGAGNGTTTFNVPDFRGRAPLGSGTGTATGATAHALGDLPGEEKHTLTAAEIPAHTHKASSGVASTTGGNVNFGTQTGKINGTKDADTDNGTGGGSAHSVLGPSAVVTMMIATGNDSAPVIGDAYLQASLTVDPNGFYAIYDSAGYVKGPFNWWEDESPV